MSAWVLLRGLARDSRHWESFPMMLEQAVGSRVVTLDLPGNGRYAHQQSPSRLAGVVDAYRCELQSLGIDGPVNLLGLSLGAMAAIEWSAHFPQEVAAAVVVNASAAGLASPIRRLRTAAVLQLLRALLDRSPVGRERRIVSVCTNLADCDIAAQRWALHAAFGRTSASNTLPQLLAAARFGLPAQQPPTPMLVLASSADRLVSVECSIAIARHWSLPIVLHPTAGHEIAMDDPAWLVRQCTRFVTPLSSMSSNRLQTEMNGSSALPTLLASKRGDP